MSAEIVIELHPQQTRAITSTATELLFGGAAGGGKSFLLRAAAVCWACEVPGLQIYLFRRLFPDLQKNHMEGPKGFPNMLAPLVNAGKCHITRDRIEFWNGSKIFLNHLERESALLKYQGTEMHVILMDELTHFTDYMYRYLRGRCRMAGLTIPERYAGLFPRIVAGTNPGSIGHHWVKETFVERDPYTVYRMPKKEGGMKRAFVPSRIEDNPSLLRDDPNYMERLEGLGDQLLVRALRDGDWDVVAGSMFGDVWRRARHVCRPFALPSHWRIWRGGDDGYVAPAACYWLTEDPEVGTIYVARELYRPGMLPEMFGELTKQGDRSIPIVGPFDERDTNQEILSGVMDAAAFTDTGQGEGSNKTPTRGAQMNKLGCKWKPADKPPGSRVHRCQNLHRLLGVNKKDPQKRPGIIFFDTCPVAIRTIPTLPRDPNNPEDVDTDGEDHAYDAITYGLQMRKNAGFKKVKIKGT